MRRFWGMAGSAALALLVVALSGSLGSASAAPIDLNTCAGATKQVIAGTSVTLVGLTHVETNKGQMDKFLATSATTLTVGGTASNASGGWSTPTQVAGTTNDYTTTWQQTIPAPAVGAPASIRFDLLYQPDQSGKSDLRISLPCVLLAGQPVSAATGGTVTTGDAKLSLTVPTGALSTDTTIVVQPSTQTPPAKFGAPVTTVYDLGPTGTTFATPVTITISYPATLPAGATTANLHVASYSNGVWRLLPTVVNIASRTLTTYASHFSLFTGTVTPGQDLVSGSLIDSAKNPVPAGVVATAVDTTGAVIATDTTDAINPGVYSLLVPDGGTYRFHFVAPAPLLFESKWLDSAAFVDGATSYTIPAAPPPASAMLASGVAFTGVVQDSSGVAVAGATVTAISSTPFCCTAYAQATTDATGAYWLVVQPGYYRLRAVAPIGLATPLARDFYNGTPSGTPFSNQASSIHLGQASSPATYNFSLSAGVRVIGTVHDSLGNPVARAFAQILVSPPCCQSPGTAQADANGAFAIVVPPGTYTAQFWPETQNGLASVFYNGQGAIDAANEFVATVGTDVSLGDTVLPVGIPVGGYVRDSLGNGVPNISVVANTNAGGSCCAGIVAATTDATGAYTVYVTAGSYRFMAQPPYGVDLVAQAFPSGTNLGLVPQQSVTAAITNEDFTLPTGYPITGTLRAADTLVPLVNINVSAQLPPPLGGCCPQFVNNFKTVGDGSFRIVVPANTYIIRANVPNTVLYVSAWYGDGNNADNATRVTVNATTSAAPIDFQLQPGYVMSGVVRDAVTLAPIANVNVSASLPPSGNFCCTGFGGASSAGDGTFRFVVPANTYILFANPPFGSTYEQMYLGDGFDANAGSRITVGPTAGGAGTGLTFGLQSGFLISGTLHDASTGATIGNTNVTVFTPAPTGGCCPTFLTSTRALGNGQFSVAIPAGTYIVRANPPQGSSYLTTWYGDGTNPGLATHLTLSGATPNAGTGLDVQMQPGFVISGHIQNISGAGVGGVNINLFQTPDPSGNPGQFQGGTQTNGAGDFRFAMPAGTYSIAIQPQANAPYYAMQWWDGGAGALYAGLAHTITVDATHAAPAINAVLQPGFLITGRITETDGITPIPGALANANVSCGPGCWTFHNGGQVNSSGNYAVVVPAGDFLLNFMVKSPTSPYLGQWWQNKPNQSQADPVHIDATTNGSPFNVSLVRGHRISGTVVLAGTTTPVAGVNVGANVAPASAQTCCVGAGGTQTDATGAFSILVAPGTYVLNVGGGNSSYVFRWYDGGAGTIDVMAATPIPATTADVTGLQLQAVQGFRISGTVTATGTTTPLAGVQVNANVAPPNQQSCCIGAGGTRTDANGAFSITVAPGTYILGIGGGPTNFVFHFYGAPLGNGAHNATLATPIPVTNADVAGLALDTIVGYRISGHVSQPGGAGAPQVGIHAANPDGTGGCGGGCAATDPNGNFDYAILPGTWIVRIDPSQTNQQLGTAYLVQYWSGMPTPTGATIINAVAGGSQTGINATLAAGNRISGVVVAAGTSTPVGGVNVGLTLAPSDPSACCVGLGGTQSAPDGSFSFAVGPGTYILNAGGGPSSYLFRWYDGGAGTQDVTRATRVPITNTDVTGIQLPATIGYRISGHVSTPTGSPASQVNVGAQSAICCGGGGGGNRTDADGNFDFAIAPGTWKITFDPSPLNAALGTNYATQWWNGATSFDMATTINASAGGTQTRMNVTLANGLRISGTVVDSVTAAPVGGVNVGVNQLTVTGACCTGVGGIPSNPDGTFSFIVNPGTYLLNVGGGPNGNYVFRWYDGTTTGTRDFHQASQINVSADVTGLRVGAILGFRMSGHVSAPDGAAAPNISIQTLDASGNCLPGGEGATTDLNGDFSFAVTPGLWKVLFNPDPSNRSSGTAYVLQWWNNASFTSATAIRATGGSSVSGINAQLASGLRISGHVLAADTGLGLPNVGVAANLASPMGCYDWSADTDTDPSGAYVLVVPSGTYRVFANAFGDGYVNGWYAGLGVIAQGFDQATSVTVPPEQSGIDLTLPVAMRITGRVTDLSGAPIAGARISANSAPPTNGFGGGAQSASDGTFTLFVAPGSYIVYVGGPNNGPAYVGHWYGTSYSDFTLATPITATTPALAITLEPGTRISGHVTGIGGAPVSSVGVAAYDATQTCCVHIAAWGSDLIGGGTDSNGYWTLVVPHGSFKIVFYPGCCGASTTYGSQYWSGKPDFASADVLVVPSAQSTASIDIALQ